ncbi:MAG: serine hydrolase [Gammaproteobacteria bacterium]
MSNSKFVAALFAMAAALAMGSSGHANQRSEQNKARATVSSKPTSVELSRDTLSQDPRFVVSKTRLQLIFGSGEFEFLQNEMTVQERQIIGLQWQTTETGATRGRWEIRDRADRSTLVASGNINQAPVPDKMHRVWLPASTFLSEPQPATDTNFEIRIVALDASNAELGKPSNAVTVKQLSRDYVQPPTDFGAGAHFPTITLLNVEENVRQLPLSQLYATYADVRVRVTNQDPQPTDPMFLKLRDDRLLFRQTAAAKAIKALAPNESLDVSLRVEAILDAPASQTPQQQQVRQWQRRRDEACSPLFYSVLDWRGNQSQTPIDAHRERPVHMDGWSQQVTSTQSAPDCDGGRCVRVSDMEKSLAQRLHGRVMGYSFALLGSQTLLGAAGKARSAADGNLDFTAQTPMTVASVSKWITAIGAMSVANTREDVSIDDMAGAYYPADWNVGNYFNGVTLSQFLSQQSGIKDYGNVKLDRNTLQTFLEQPVSNRWRPTCTGSAVVRPDNAVNPSTAMTRCYSNINFAIFREFIPAMAGATGNADEQYEQLVRQNVFERVGRENTGCRPRGDIPHAFGYNGPNAEKGQNWGDVRDECGGAGWFVSAVDIAAVLASINARDGRILRETASNSDLDTMRVRGLGVDTFNNFELSKNGAWGGGKGMVHAGAAIFGPVNGPNIPATLLVNSTITSGPNCGNNALDVLRDAYNEALYTQ